MGRLLCRQIQSSCFGLLVQPLKEPVSAFGLQRKLMRFSCPCLRDPFVSISLRELNVVSAAALAEGPWDGVR